MAWACTRTYITYIHIVGVTAAVLYKILAGIKCTEIAISCNLQRLNTVSGSGPSGCSFLDIHASVYTLITENFVSHWDCCKIREAVANVSNYGIWPRIKSREIKIERGCTEHKDRLHSHCPRAITRCVSYLQTLNPFLSYTTIDWTISSFSSSPKCYQKTTDSSSISFQFSQQ